MGGLASPTFPWNKDGDDDHEVPIVKLEKFVTARFNELEQLMSYMAASIGGLTRASLHVSAKEPNTSQRCGSYCLINLLGISNKFAIRTVSWKVASFRLANNTLELLSGQPNAMLIHKLVSTYEFRPGMQILFTQRRAHLRSHHGFNNSMPL